MMFMDCSSIREVAEESKSTAGTKSNDKGSHEIQGDIGLIRLAGLAIELGIAIPAFDMGEQRWTKCSAPPGKLDFFHIRASAIGTGLVLG